MPVNGVLITRSNIHELTSDDILSFNSKEYWHKFFLENGGLYDKEAVLQAVLDSISPFDLVPVKYTVEEKDSYFLARNCGQAIEKFCLNLFSPIKLGDSSGEVIISIQTCCMSVDQYKMNMQFHLKKAINKRYDLNQEGFINLSSFHKEPELYDVIYCPLSKPRFLMYVLSILKRILNINAIDLSNNDLETLNSLEVLHDFENLTYLDLSNNKIDDPNLPEILQKATPCLEELHLRGNPICSLFEKDLEYLKWIRDKNQNIRNLDGVSINLGLPNHQVYLCSEETQQIINEFLHHFFTLYDKDRQALVHTYDKDAILSLTLDYLMAQTFSQSNDVFNRLECYLNEAVDLLKNAPKNQNRGSIHQKKKNIINVLTKLPMTEHDPFSFKIDSLYFKEPFIVLTVSGVFKDFQETPRIRSFNRTFALKRISSEEFKITNDLFHVTNATEKEINNSFKHKKPVEKTRTLITKEEEDNLIKAVSKMTEMNPECSKRCLENCDWDVKKTLEIFLENYEKSEIPLEAFKSA